MPSTVVTVVNDIFNPPTSYNYYIIPSKLKADNATVVNNGWTYRASTDVIMGGYKTTIGPTYGFITADGSTAIGGPLRFTFSDAAQNTSTGIFYDFVFEITSAQTATDSSHDRYTAVCALGNSLWLDAYSAVVSADRFDSDNKYTGTDSWRVGVSVDVNMYIVNKQGNVVSGTFAFPFQDIDAVQDPDKTNTSHIRVKGTYAERVRVRRNCPNIYVCKNTWLTWTGKSISGAGVGQHETINIPAGFTNSSNSITDPGQEYFTGFTAIFESIAPPSSDTLLVWTGCNCGTSFTGENLSVYTIAYNSNGGKGAPDSQYKTAGIPVTLSSKVPSNVVKATYDGNGAKFRPNSNGTHTVNVSQVFRGWAITKADADAGNIAYQPGQTYALEGNRVLYAVWGAGPLGTLPGIGSNDGELINRANYRFEDNVKTWTTSRDGTTKVSADTKISQDTTFYAKWEYAVIMDPNPGYVRISGQSTQARQVTWKKVGQSVTIPTNYTFEWTGHQCLGLSSTANAENRQVEYTLPYTYSTNAPITLYAVWESRSFQVTFKDGYSASGSDVIKKVSVSYGGSVSNQDLPQQGAAYPAPYDKVFRLDGIYKFAGWSGSYKNVTSNRTVTAMWQFSPIWLKNSTWKSYEPDDGGSYPEITYSFKVHGGSLTYKDSPELWMDIIVTKFTKGVDKSAGLRIKRAALRESGPNSFPYDMEIGACMMMGDVASYGDDYVTMYDAVTHYCDSTLLIKPASAATWNSSQYVMTDPVDLAVPNPNSEHVYLCVTLNSNCDCIDHNIERPVYCADVTEYIPEKPKGYFWVMKNGQWKLSRPFYICKKCSYKEKVYDETSGEYITRTVHNELCWCSCEEPTIPVYGADAHKINLVAVIIEGS